MTAHVAILGATGTIGSSLARRLVARGDHVFLIGRSADKLAALSAELNQPCGVADFSTSAGIDAALQDAATALGRLDGIVHAVGSVLLKAAHLTSDEEFRLTLEINLFSAFSVVKAAAKLMREHGGSVVLFSSAAAEIGLANHEAIAAAKAGVTGLARSAAATYAARNLRFNVISPGLVKSEMTRRIWENPAAASASQAMHALGRLGEPDRVASLAAWLVDPANDWMTGQVIGVDGGLGSIVPRPRG